MKSWICCQIGAREHYAIPRALHQNNQLSMLLTDAWVPSESALNHFPQVIPQSIRDRYHNDLPNQVVKGFNKELAAFEISHKIRRTPSWPRTIQRNNWFQYKAIEYLESARDRLTLSSENTVLFTYSYAALHLLRYAKKQRWTTILGQIDPGIVEENIVACLQTEHPQLRSIWQPAPQQYWDIWHQECALTDQIIVNSEWSKQALQQNGLPSRKISIIPLAYTPSERTQSFHRDYPTHFSNTRSLRVLFLGQVILRKGIAALLKATRLLQNFPIEFWIVGRSDIDTSQFQQPNIHWIGSVSRSETGYYYQQADVLIFPTRSDGFGLTQLEAQSWKLPVIASRFCGSVIQDNINGLILDEVSETSIVETLRRCIDEPALLPSLAQCSKVESNFSLSKISQALEHCLSDSP